MSEADDVFMKELLGETKEKTTTTKTKRARSSSNSKKTKTKTKSKVPKKKQKKMAPLTVSLDAGKGISSLDTAGNGPPVIVDMSKGADRRTGQVKRKSTKTTRSRKKTRSGKKPTKKKPSVVQVSQTPPPVVDITPPVVERLRDTARKNLPSDASDRIVSAITASCLSLDPLKEEDKTTLASLTKGIGHSLLPPPPPVSVPDDLTSSSTTLKARRRKSTRKSKAVVVTSKKRTRVKKESPMVSYGLDEVSDLSLVVGNATPEAVVVGGITESESEHRTIHKQGNAFGKPREVSKNQGVSKKAPLGVAVPSPVNRSSKLRLKVSQSSMSHPSLSQDSIELAEIMDQAIVCGGPHLDPAIPNIENAASAPAHLSKPSDWETKSPQDLADESDARRMDVPDYSKDHAPTGMVRSLAELKKVCSDHNRLSMDDKRTEVARYLDGIISAQCLRVDMIAKVRSNNDPLGRAAAEDQVMNGDDDDTPQRAARRKGAGKVLVFNETEAMVLQALCCEPHQQQQVNPNISQNGAESSPNIVLRDRMKDWIRKPMSELEVAVLMGAKPSETMMYFMLYDDAPSLIKRIYETAMRVGGMVTSASLLCGTQTGHPENAEQFRLNKALSTIQAVLYTTNELWQEACKPENKKNQDPQLLLELYAKKESLNMMRAVLTGDLDGHRHNMVRAAVAREEFLMGLYAEPSMRCITNSAAAASARSSNHKENNSVGGQVKPSEWPSDKDVILKMRQKLAEYAVIHNDVSASVAAKDDTSKLSDTEIAVLVAAADVKAPWWKPMMPKLGTPATKSYNADYYRPPDPTQKLERPCVEGPRYCVAWWMSSHGGWPACGALNRANGAWVMREYYSPDVWAGIVREGSLPAIQTHCRFCKLFRGMYHWIQLCILNLQTRCIIPKDPSAPNGTKESHIHLGVLLGQDHCDAIEPDGGYTQDDMIPIGTPTDGSWTGIMAPMVAFRFNRYIPGKCVPPINLNQRPESKSSAATTTAKYTISRAELPCFYEQVSSDFS